MGKTLYEVGIPTLNAEAIERIHAMGYKIGLLADQAEPHINEGYYDDVIDVNYKYLDEEMAHIALSAPDICGVICRNERYVTARAMICEYFGLAGPSVESVRSTIDKTSLRAILTSRDPRLVPQFTVGKSDQELIAFAHRVGYPIIMKPHLLTQSPLTTISHNEQELVENYRFIRKDIFTFYNKYRIFETPQIIAEEYIQGSSYSVAVFVDHNGAAHYCSDIMHIRTAERTGVHDTYVYRRKIPARLSRGAEEDILRVSHQVIKSLNFKSTPVRIELVLDQKRGIKIVAVSPRTGSFRRRLYELSYGVDLLEQEIRIALGEVPRPHGECHAYSAAYKLYPEKEGIFIGITGYDSEIKCADFFVRPRRGQLIGPAKNGYEATALVVVSHQDAAEFYRLCDYVEHLKIVSI